MYLFGSCARGEMLKNSDIDIYIVSNKSKEEISNIAHRISEIVKIQFQLINTKPEMLETEKNNYSDIYNKIKDNINEGIKIDLDLF